MNLIDWCVKRPIFCNLLMLFILFSGVIALTGIRNEFSPVFSRDEIEVTVVYQGATPTEVEESICIKIENALQDVAEILDVDSLAKEGVGVVTAKLKVRTDPYRVLEKIKLRVDSIEDLPTGSLSPQTRLRFSSPTLMRFILYGDLPKRELNQVANIIRNEVMDLSDIDYVYIKGNEDYEIKIDISEFSLQKYSLQISDVVSAIKAHSFSRAEGELKTDGRNIKIYTENRLYSSEEYQKIPIVTSENGVKILLKDIATVYEGYNDESFYYRFNGKPAISMKLHTPRDADSIAVCERVKQYLQEKQEVFPENLKLRLWFDRSTLIVEQIDTLSGGAILGIILVVICLSIFLNFKISFWVALGIPISYAGGFFVLYFLGKSLNLISMFAMIIALGMVVDDAIIVGENIEVYKKNGEKDAAIRGTKEMVFPILGATLTTVIAFIPLFFIPGMVGNWIREIPIAVIAILVTSFIECIFILPSHINSQKTTVEHPVRRKLNHGIDYVIHNWFGTFYKKVLRYPVLFVVFVLSVTVIGVGLVRSHAVEYIFFPEIDSLHIRAELRFASGTTQDNIDKYTRYLEKTVSKLNDMFPDTQRPLVDSMFAITDDNYGYVEVQLCSNEYRKYHSREIMSAWEKIVGEVPDVISINFWGDQYAPVEIPIEIELQSANPQELFAASQALKKELYQTQGVYNIHDNTPPETLVLTPTLKEEGIFLGISQKDVSQKLQGGFAGQEVFKLQRNSQEVIVRLGYKQKDQELGSLNIKAPSGYEVPLTNVVEFVLRNKAQTILRKNKKRFLAVRANINNELTTPFNVIEKLKQQFFHDMKRRYPGVKILIAGQEKENQESVSHLLLGFSYAILAIFFILALILNSYIQPIIVLTIVPFGVVGAIYGHWFMGLPLSIMSMFGIVALSGIVVNDSLVFLDQINLEIRKGSLVKDAVFKAGVSRFRAIFLTSFTTIVGLVPVLYETDLQASSIIPMAVSLVFGLFFATIVTLFLIPILFLVVNFCRRVVYWLIKGLWVRREKVEPHHNLLTESL